MLNAKNACNNDSLPFHDDLYNLEVTSYDSYLTGHDIKIFTTKHLLT